MKKAITFIALLMVASIVSAVTLSRVQSETFKMNQKRVLNNVISEVETAVTENAAAVSAVVVVDTNVTTTATSYTPTAVGQLLTGGNGTGTNAMWVAEGLTTNDWVKVSEYVE